MLGDEPLSISNRFPEENDTQNPHWSPGIPVADNFNPHNSSCELLREELAVKDRELNVLREEVFNSAEELEEARSRYTTQS